MTVLYVTSQVSKDKTWLVFSHMQNLEAWGSLNIKGGPRGHEGGQGSVSLGCSTACWAGGSVSVKHTVQTLLHSPGWFRIQALETRSQ